MIDDLVCSLEIAQELKKQGYPQDTLYIWQDGELFPADLEVIKESGEWFAAPLAGELLKQLSDFDVIIHPMTTSIEFKGIPPHTDFYEVIANNGYMGVEYHSHKVSLADALGNLWLKLKQEDLI